jgi:hypothetical protein
MYREVYTRFTWFPYYEDSRCVDQTWLRGAPVASPAQPGATARRRDGRTAPAHFIIALIAASGGLGCCGSLAHSPVGMPSCTCLLHCASRSSREELWQHSAFLVDFRIAIGTSPCCGQECQRRGRKPRSSQTALEPHELAELRKRQRTRSGKRGRLWN